MEYIKGYKYVLNIFTLESFGKHIMDRLDGTRVYI